MALTAIHPGEHLAEELEALDMSAAELARKINVPTNRITQILNGTRAITGDTALRLAHFLWHERSVLAESTEPLRPAARPREGRKIHQGTSHAKTARACPRMKGRTPLTGASSGSLVSLLIASQLAGSPRHSLLFLLDPLLLQ
jgi:addiction module HigA family antidote